MTISTPSTDRRLADPCGFTLTELMISAVLGAFILLGILTTFLMIGRTGANAANYAELEAQARKALETFGEDVRMANNVDWNGVLPSSSPAPTIVTLTIPPSTLGGGTVTKTYYLDTNPTSPTYRCFLWKYGTLASTNPGTVLIHNVRTLAFNAYKIGSAGPATNALDTKQIQLSLTAARSTTTVATATDMVLSARFILRNKPVST